VKERRCFPLLKNILISLVVTLLATAIFSRIPFVSGLLYGV